MIDYAAAAKEREEWLAWLQAKAAERRLSDPYARIKATKEKECSV